MLGAFHLPEIGRGKIEAFTFTGTSASRSAVWQKPRGYDFCSILCVGSGGGGGGGAGNSAGSAKGGGGGGASGGFVRALFPIWVLPDVLYIDVSAGGAGGNGGTGGSGNGGGQPGASSVRLAPSASDTLALLASQSNSPAGAGGGTSSAGGTGGAAPAASSANNMRFINMAIAFAAIAGTAGTNGGAHTGAIGVAHAIGNTHLFLPGTGGAGCTTTEFAGGAHTAIADSPYIGSAGGIAGGGVGNPGFRIGSMLAYYGGTGGGSSNSTTGGRGGDAVVPGGGGGGGGGGVTTGGRGGDGGPGLVVIHCW
jgi:hypothetical protein